MSDSILHEVAGGLARITLNRPEKRNALSLEMIEELSRAIDDVRDDASTRVVLVTARGKAFCSGMDLSAVPLDDPDEAGRFGTALAEVYGKLLTLPIPLLCGVDGPVMGGGGGLALAADLVWAGPRALFAFPETRIGVVPALVSVVVRRRVSPLTLSGIVTTGNHLQRRALGPRGPGGLSGVRIGDRRSGGVRPEVAAGELGSSHAPDQGST